MESAFSSQVDHFLADLWVSDPAEDSEYSWIADDSAGAATRNIRKPVNLICRP
jgi:hypothetical protein